MTYIISSCLLGVKCRYNGKSYKNDKIQSLFLNNNVTPICPELLGGLKAPRNPAEIILKSNGEREVVDTEGNNLTDEFNIGAKAALAIAKIVNADCAILKSCSPSCGSSKIYDGTFSGKLICGAGITVELLKKNGIRVMNEMEWENE